jgi:hypothetical protein
MVAQKGVQHSLCHLPVIARILPATVHCGMIEDEGAGRFDGLAPGLERGGKPPRRFQSFFRRIW